MMHNQFKFILMETSHPGNIGAAARAIKTMGFGSLVLVKPKDFPSDEALRRSAGAADILEQAQVVSSLDEAIVGCHLVIGTSVRDRSVEWPTQTSREMATYTAAFAAEDSQNKVAVLFGRERTGLENAELDKTQIQVRIPANVDYSSLNLASAVQILAYDLNAELINVGLELNSYEVLNNKAYNQESDASNTHLNEQLMQEQLKVSGKEQRQRLASADELHGYYSHLVDVLGELDFIRESPPTKLMRKITRLYNRAQPNIEELNILRGILTAIEKKVSPNKK